MDPLEILNKIGGEDPPTDEELAEARALMVEALREAAGGDTPNLEDARALRNGIDRVDEETSARTATREAEAAEAAELLEGIEDSDPNPPEDSPSSEDSPEEDEGDPEEADSPEGDEEASDDEDEAVAAALSRHRRRANVRTNDETPPVVPVTASVVASGPAVGSSAPETITDVANLFHRHAHQINRGRASLIRLERQVPESRLLTNNPQHNNAILASIMDERAIVAAGGICAPLPAEFDHPICGERGRPIRDMLPSFGATRGGVRYTPNASLADVDGAVTVWTHDTDADPGENTKPCPEVECPDEVEVYVDAVVACLQIGNFAARFNPEFWSSRLDLLMVLHDRIAEQTLFATMAGNATNKTAVDQGNTVRTLFHALAYENEYLRLRHRVLPGTALRFVAPVQLRGALRQALGVRQGDGPEIISAADSYIAGLFSNLNINVTWTVDLQIPNAQTAGAVPEFANPVTLLFPEGTFFFVDGGTLDLGTEVRDSTLNATNNRQAFIETFEQVAFRGCEALQITVPVGAECICPPTIQEVEA